MINALCEVLHMLSYIFYNSEKGYRKSPDFMNCIVTEVK